MCKDDIYLNHFISRETRVQYVVIAKFFQQLYIASSYLGNKLPVLIPQHTIKASLCTSSLKTFNKVSLDCV